MLVFCTAESPQRLTAEEVPVALKQSSSPRAVRRSRTPTTPITRGPEAPRYFSGCPVSPLLASDWTEKGGSGVSPAPFGDFCAYKSHPGSGAGEAPSKSTRFQESPIKERKKRSAFQRSFSILSTISPMAPSKQWHTTVAPEASTSGTALAGQKARSAASSMGRSFM